MKTKLLTLLTLLVTCVTGAWAEAITVTWLPNNMSSKTMVGTASVNDILTVSDIALSSDVETVESLGTWDSKKWVTFKSKTVSTAAGPKNGINKDDYLTFTVTVKTGYKFTPTGITAYAVGNGTGNNGVGIFTETLSENISGGYTATNSSSASSVSQMSKAITSSALTEGNTYTFYIYFSQNNTTDYKGVGMRDVVLTGTYEVASTDPVPASITTQPSNTEAVVGVETTLSVVAAGYPDPDYQWYECDDAEKTNAEAIDGATSASYSFTPDATGTRYFYVTVNNENNVEPVVSNVVTVTVSAGTTANPTFKVYGNTVQLACATADATIYYELDNADVKSSATKSTYSGAFIPASSGTIYAYAQKDGYTSSAVVSQAVTLSTVGDVVGGLIANVQAAKDATTTVFENITVTSSASLSWDGRGIYPNHMKTSGTVTLTASNGATIKSIKIYGTSNDGSKVATVTAGDGATVVSSPAELMPRDVTVGGVQTMTEIVITVDEPTINNSISFSLGRESRLYIEVYGEDNVAITPAYAKTTYVTTKALDFTAVEGLDAYVATAAASSGVTMTKVEAAVPAGTPLLLIGTAGTAYNVPVAASATAPETNYLEAGDGTTEFNGSTYDYILYSDGKFYQIGSGTVATDKAYLHLTEAPGARALDIIFDDGETTSIKQVEGLGLKVEGYYNLNGQRVAQPTKGLYIVNGKKVIIK